MNRAIEDHLQSIEDFVLVEDKLVTYKWISKALKVHINTAKQLLHAFSLKEEFSKKLLVTYLIAGVENNVDGMKFCLVKKDELQKVKQYFKKIICEHVYSIQRDTNFDAKNLYNADYAYELSEDDKKFSSIQKNDDIVRRNKVIDVASTSASCSNVKSSTITEKKQSTATKNNPDLAKSKLDLGAKVEVKQPSEDVTAEAKRSISPKKESTKSSPSKAGALKNNKKLKNAPSKGPSIGTFFNKQAAMASNKKKEVPVANVDEGKEESKENIGTIVNQATPEMFSETDTDTNKHAPINKKKENSKKRKKKKHFDDSASKKRKRIFVASDSESSESEMDVEEEREPSPEPEPEPVVLPESDEEIIPPTPVEKGRKRIRKQVDRTFTDEDGFILTKKEYVYESCSDDEAPALKKPETGKMDKEQEKEETPPKNNKKMDKKSTNENKKNNKKKSSPKKTPPKNKQKTIMNFFQRK